MPQPDRILKRKLNYLYIDGMAGAPANSIRVAIEESSVTFSMAPNGVVQMVNGTSRMRIDLSLDQANQLATVTEIHLGNRRDVQATDLIGSLAGSLPNVISSPHRDPHA